MAEEVEAFLVTLWMCEFCARVSERYARRPFAGAFAVGKQIIRGTEMGLGEVHHLVQVPSWVS
jgi:hypothetical protein